MAKFELSNEVKPLDRIISRLAGECGYEVQQVFNDLLRYIIHGFSPSGLSLLFISFSIWTCTFVDKTSGSS